MIYRRFIPPLPASAGLAAVSLFSWLLVEHLRNRKRTLHRVNPARQP
ncbi:MAG: hypothetical protein H6R15_214 [Proteobacteria bacterium]|nr:hypothetical protein [Pseudomonadota bacterium]